MSARAGLRPAIFLALFERELGEVGDEVANLCAGDAEAPHRLAGLAFAGHDHRRQRGERAARAVEHAGHERRLADFALEHAVDVLAEPLELLRGRDAGRVALLGDADRAERRRVDLIDQAARGEDDFRAAAADVGHGHLAARDVERPCTLKNASRASSSDEMTSTSRSSSRRTRWQNSGPFSASRTALVAIAEMRPTP